MHLNELPDELLLHILEALGKQTFRSYWTCACWAAGCLARRRSLSFHPAAAAAAAGIVSILEPSRLPRCRRWCNDCQPFVAVPRVCRRWRCLSLTIQLLRQLSVSIETRQRHNLSVRLRSLCIWMAHAAGHVRSLELALLVSGPEQLDEKQAEVEALLAGAVAACGAGGLRSLRLFSNAPVSFSSWVCLAPSLRWLQLRGDSQASVDGRFSLLCTPLCSLTLLEHLSLRELDYDMPAGNLPDLPASLTSLELAGMAYMPTQVCRCQRQATGRTHMRPGL